MANEYTISRIKLPNGDICNLKNTDTKVAQTVSTATNWRKVILGHNQGTSSTTDVAEVTEKVYGSKYISAQPSTGTLRANIYRVEDKVELQWNSDDQSLDFVFI